MHLEFLVEDKSGRVLLEILLPKLLGGHTFRVHSYKGVGHFPKDLRPRADPGKRILLEQLPRLVAGYRRTPAIDAVVVVCDVDRTPCADLLEELNALAALTAPPPRFLFRLAIEEMEAWLPGDREALYHAFPKAKRKPLETYVQDSICGTWEVLADAVHPGGSAALKKAGWHEIGRAKCEWAAAIGPHMEPGRNQSISFSKFCSGVGRLTSSAPS